MIKVNILHVEEGQEDQVLGEIEIHRLSPADDLVSYAAKYIVDNVEEVAAYSRSPVWHWRTEQNVLALVESALQELTPEEQKLKGDIDAPRSPDLERRLPRVVREIQGWSDRLRNN